MLRHKLMLGDVDQQLGLEELLEDVLGRHVDQGLLGTGGHPHLYHNDCSGDVLFLHSCAIGLDGFDPNFRIIREEDKHLVCGVIIVRYQDHQITPEYEELTKFHWPKENHIPLPGRPSLAGFVTKLLLELLQSLIQFILARETQFQNRYGNSYLRDKIAPVVAELHHSLAHLANIALILTCHLNVTFHIL